MRVLLVNPNTTTAFTKKIEETANKYKAQDTDIVAINPNKGPRSVESIYEEVLSAYGSLEVILPEIDNYDAFIIACYSDHPVIYSLRELTDKPVVGIAEASMYLACMLGHKFSIVSTNDEWIPLLWDAVNRYGLSERCASVRTIKLPVLAAEDISEDEEKSLISIEAKRAVEEDGAEVICLGCAGMSGLDKEIEAILDVPVLDGVVCALSIVEGFSRYGVKTSKRRAYTTPVYKKIDNMPQFFESKYKR